MASTVKVDVSYSQLAVYASALQQPFNDWTDRHVAQGFAWRLGSVSFRTMVEDGSHLVEIDITDHVGAIHPDAVRVIDTPFEVPEDGKIEIGSIYDAVTLSLPAGSFLLRCEFLQTAGGDGERVHLTFARKDAPRFAVVRADESLSTNGELLTTAHAAPG